MADANMNLDQNRSPSASNHCDDKETEPAVVQQALDYSSHGHSEAESGNRDHSQLIVNELHVTTIRPSTGPSGTHHAQVRLKNWDGCCIPKRKWAAPFIQGFSEPPAR